MPFTPVRRVSDSESSAWICAGEVQGLFPGKSKLILGPSICPKCGNVLSRGFCPICSTALARPTLSFFHFECPFCAKSIKSPINLTGTKAKCPKCGKVLLIPEIETQPSATAAEPKEKKLPRALGSKLCFNCGGTIDEKAGVCPSCGVAQPPATNHRVTLADEFEEKKKPHKINRKVLDWVVGIVVLSVLGSTIRDSQRNATCPACGYRFHIPDLRNRGGYLMFRAEYECPNCLLRFPAVALYNYQDDKVRKETDKLNREVEQVFGPPTIK